MATVTILALGKAGSGRGPMFHCGDIQVVRVMLAAQSCVSCSDSPRLPKVARTWRALI